MGIETFAKILVEQGNACGLTSRDFEAEISKRGEAMRREGDSPAQSFTRYATETPEGRLLLKAAVMAPKPVEAPQDFADPNPKPAGPAHAEMDRLARDLAKEKKISFERAFTNLYTDPDRKELVARLNRESAEAMRRVHEQREPIWAAERAFSR
jgi:hypothetical protein